MFKWLMGANGANKDGSKVKNSTNNGGDCVDIVSISESIRHAVQWLNDDEINDVIDDAWDSIPDDLKNRVANINIVVDDYPEQKYASELPPNSLLLGLYVGIPLTKRENYGLINSPDIIHIYKNNIFLVSLGKEDAAERVRRTVLHEIGHYFGLDDDRLHSLGY